MLTPTQTRIIRRRYPNEGASDNLCRDLCLQAWQVRHYANRVLGLKVDDALKRRKARRYSAGMYTTNE